MHCPSTRTAFYKGASLNSWICEHLTLKYKVTNPTIQPRTWRTVLFTLFFLEETYPVWGFRNLLLLWKRHHLYKVREKQLWAAFEWRWLGNCDNFTAVLPAAHFIMCTTYPLQCNALLPTLVRFIAMDECAAMHPFAFALQQLPTKCQFARDFRSYGKIWV